MAMTKTIQATVKNRTDTAANWTQKNPVLAEGEIIVVQTSAGETRLKIGDGVKTFTQLPYIDEQIYNNVVTSVNGETGDVTLPGDFIIAGTHTETTGLTLDKTFDQIQEAISAGKLPIIKLEAEGPTITLPVVSNTSGIIMFSGSYSADGQIMSISVIVTKSGADYTSVTTPATNPNRTMKQISMDANPTTDMQIATKKYVDDHVSADVYVDFWPTGTEAEYNGNLNGYQIELATDQTFDAIFDSIKAGNKIVARLYKDANKSEFPVSSVDTAVTGSKEFGAIHFQFVTVDTDAVAGFPFIGEGIMMLKIETSTAIFLVANHNVLPTPNADGTDNGKVPTINGTAWELKKPPTGSPDAVLYTAQTLTDAQKKQARENVDAAIGDFSVTATIQDFPACTLDKTFNQIQEAISKGKRVFARLNISSDNAFILELLSSTSTEIQFTSFDYNYGLNKAQAYKLVVSPNKSEIAFGAAPTLTSEDTLHQVKMAAGPSFDMEIATKQYVDAQAGDFIVTATLSDDTNCTLDKTFDQIQEAIHGGKRVLARLSTGLSAYMPLVLYNSEALFFGATTITYDSIEVYTLTVGKNVAKFVDKSAVTYNSNSAIPQVSMAAAPTEDMEIATKKYVDGKISDKEIILSSSTAGSTKKFKLTIDDTGTLTASEITA